MSAGREDDEDDDVDLEQKQEGQEEAQHEAEVQRRESDVEDGQAAGGVGARVGVASWMGASLRARFREPPPGRTRAQRKPHSYSHSRHAPDEIVSGARKKKSALHGTGSSRWHEPKQWFYSLLDMSWKKVFLLITACYALMILFWSLINLPLAIVCDQSPGTAGVFMPGTFGAAFILASSNLVTLGFGPCLPASYLAYVLTTVQQYMGLTLSVIMLSVTVSKFQLPKPDLIFSKKALVTTRDGVPVLLIRIGNRRANLLYDTRVSVSVLVARTTAEGESFIEHHRVRAHFPPSMTATATISHIIKGRSPLRRLLFAGRDALAQAALSVSFSCHDSVYNAELHCTTQFRGRDLVVGGSLFEDVMERIPGGKGIRANFDRFDGFKPGPALSFDDLLAALEDASCEEEEEEEDEQRQLEQHGTEDAEDQEHDEQDGDGRYEGRIESSHRRMQKAREQVHLAPGHPQQHADDGVLFNDVTGAPARIAPSSEALLSADAAATAYTTALASGAAPPAAQLVFGARVVSDRVVRLCPLSRVVFMLLTELDIAYEVIDLDWANKPAWFLRLSPEGRTPLLHLRGRWLVDSRAIMSTLLATFPEQARMIDRASSLPAPHGHVYDRLQAVIVPAIQAQHAPDSAPAATNTPTPTPQQHAPPPGGAVLLASARASDWLGLVVLLSMLQVPCRVALVESGEVALALHGRQLARGRTSALAALQEVFTDAWGGLARYRDTTTLLEMCEALFEDSSASPASPGSAAQVSAESENENGAAEQPAGNTRRAAALGAIEHQLAQQQAGGLSWLPFLSGQERAGLDDALLGSALRVVPEAALTALPFVGRYVRACANARLFEAADVAASPASGAGGVVLGVPLMHSWSVASEEAFEEVRMDAAAAADPLGELTPRLAMNTLYLAVGCLVRGDRLARCCPYSRAIEMALHEAGVPAGIVRVDMRAKPAWFLRSSTGKCPNAYWNGAWYPDSQQILGVVLPALFAGPMSALASRPMSLSTEAAMPSRRGMQVFNAADSALEPFLSAGASPAGEALLAALEQAADAAASRDAAWWAPAPADAANDAGVAGVASGPNTDEVALFCSLWRFVSVAVAWYRPALWSALRARFPTLLGVWVPALAARDSALRSAGPHPAPLHVVNVSLAMSAKDPVCFQRTPAIDSAEAGARAACRADIAAALSVERPPWLEQPRAGGDAAGPMTVPAAAAAAAAGGALRRLLQLIDDSLSEPLDSGHGARAFLCGHSLGLADIMVFSPLRLYADLWRGMGHAEPWAVRDFARVAAWLCRMEATPRFRSVLSPLAPGLFALHLCERRVLSLPAAECARRHAQIELLLSQRRREQQQQQQEQQQEQQRQRQQLLQRQQQAGSRKALSAARSSKAAAGSSSAWRRGSAAPGQAASTAGSDSSASASAGRKPPPPSDLLFCI